MNRVSGLRVRIAPLFTRVEVLADRVLSVRTDPRRSTLARLTVKLGVAAIDDLEELPYQRSRVPAKEVEASLAVLPGVGVVEAVVEAAYRLYGLADLRAAHAAAIAAGQCDLPVSVRDPCMAALDQGKQGGLHRPDLADERRVSRLIDREELCGALERHVGLAARRGGVQERRDLEHDRVEKCLLERADDVRRASVQHFDAFVRVPEELVVRGPLEAEPAEVVPEVLEGAVDVCPHAPDCRGGRRESPTGGRSRVSGVDALNVTLVGALAGAVAAGIVTLAMEKLRSREIERDRLKFWLFHLRWYDLKLKGMIDRMPDPVATDAFGAARGTVATVDRMRARLAPREPELHLLSLRASGVIADLLTTMEALADLGSVPEDHLRREVDAIPRYAAAVGKLLRICRERAGSALAACEESFMALHPFHRGRADALAKVRQAADVREKASRDPDG